MTRRWADPETIAPCCPWCGLELFVTMDGDTRYWFVMCPNDACITREGFKTEAEATYALIEAFNEEG